MGTSRQHKSGNGPVTSATGGPAISDSSAHGHPALGNAAALEAMAAGGSVSEPMSLLDAIASFKFGGMNPVETYDRSAPVLTDYQRAKGDNPLLDAIEGFKKGSLKHVETNDRSAPVVGELLAAVAGFKGSQVPVA